MFSGLLGGLLIAWLLEFFIDASQVFIEVLEPMLHTDLSKSHYYFAFALIGLIAGLVGKNY